MLVHQLDKVLPQPEVVGSLRGKDGGHGVLGHVVEQLQYYNRVVVVVAVASIVVAAAASTFVAVAVVVIAAAVSTQPTHIR